MSAFTHLTRKSLTITIMSTTASPSSITKPKGLTTLYPLRANFLPACNSKKDDSDVRDNPNPCIYEPRGSHPQPALIILPGEYKSERNDDCRPDTSIDWRPDEVKSAEGEEREIVDLSGETRMLKAFRGMVGTKSGNVKVKEGIPTERVS